MKKQFLPVVLCLLLMSCERSCQSFKKSHQATARHYEVIMYSGGDTVFYDKFTGTINDVDNGDGMFYYKGDTLIEISGDYVIKSDN